MPAHAGIQFCPEIQRLSGAGTGFPRAREWRRLV